jgi:hypothetical protein
VKTSECAGQLEATLEVICALNASGDIGSTFSMRIDDYGFQATIHLLNYEFWRDREDGTAQTQNNAIRSVMRKVMCKLGNPKITRGEYGFYMVHKGVEFHLWGYPSKYSVQCEKTCYAVSGDKRILIKNGQEINLETEEPCQTSQ